jgi:hypothetical protein
MIFEFKYTLRVRNFFLHCDARISNENHEKQKRFGHKHCGTRAAMPDVASSEHDEGRVKRRISEFSSFSFFASQKKRGRWRAAAATARFRRVCGGKGRCRLKFDAHGARTRIPTAESRCAA